MNSQTDYRKSNGSRLEGHGLAIRIAQEMTGMTLAQAYVVARSAGFALRINKFDGVPHPSQLKDERQALLVDVVAGIVRKSCVA
jgi:hypothetical protein